MNETERKVRKKLAEKGLSLEMINPSEQKGRLDKIIEECYNIALDAFGKWLPYEAINSRTRDSECIMILRDKQGRSVGYTVNEKLNYSGREINYYATALLRREIQGLGIYSCLNKLRAEIIPCPIIMTRTQNPVVYRKISRTCKQLGYKVYPDGKPISYEVIGIAKTLSEEVNDDLVVSEVYFGRSLMNDTPHPGTEKEEKIWKKLNIDKGDAVVMIGIKNG